MSNKIGLLEKIYITVYFTWKKATSLSYYFKLNKSHFKQVNLTLNKCNIKMTFR